jgi:hypothetical protein
MSSLATLRKGRCITSLQGLDNHGCETAKIIGAEYYAEQGYCSLNPGKTDEDMAEAFAALPPNSAQMQEAFESYLRPVKATPGGHTRLGNIRRRVDTREVARQWKEHIFSSGIGVQLNNRMQDACWAVQMYVPAEKKLLETSL